MGQVEQEIIKPGCFEIDESGGCFKFSDGKCPHPNDCIHRRSDILGPKGRDVVIGMTMPGGVPTIR